MYKLFLTLFQFDSLPKYNSKRQSADFQFIDGGEGSNKGGDGGEWNGNGSDGNDNGDVQVVFENRRKSRNERLEELETVGSEFVESSSKEVRILYFLIVIYFLLNYH